jgi:peroxiredoxin
MAWTPSTMPALGSPAADFVLSDTVSERQYNIKQLRGDKATVVMFLSNRSPCVRHIRDELLRVAHDYRAKGVSFAAISSTDAETYPEDAPEQMRHVALRLGFPFPYLYDETQTVARAYQAVCTPDFFVYDAELRLAYRGRFDDSHPNNRTAPVTGRDLRGALGALVLGRPVDVEQKPSLGCGIKWQGEEADGDLFFEQTVELWR